MKILAIYDIKTLYSIEGYRIGMKYIDIINNNKQEHLLKYLKMADKNQRRNLIKEIKSIDFEQLNELYKISNRDIDKVIKGFMISHIDFVDKYKLDKKEFEKFEKIGCKKIKSGEYAVVTMAGGQGTRLGHDGPKGTFYLDVKPKKKSLFEILSDNLKLANSKYNTIINWYIMTSTANYNETVSFFEENSYFNYPKENIMFFEQSNLPLLSEDGKLLIDSELNIKVAADGNGCVYSSIRKSGILRDMKKKHIKWIFIGAVDNALLNMVDPILLGLTISQKHEIGSKSVVKRDPHERVGVFCKKNSVPAVIEYSELPEAMAEETDEFGELLYGESHIMCNLFSIKAIEKISNQKLPYHSAHKKANYIDEKGKLIEATQPNAYKYEAFIFDGFNYFNEMSILRGKREEDFAPVKNAKGIDSPETAKKLYNDFHKSK